MSLPPLITGSCNDYAKPLDLGDMGSSDGSQESDSLSFEGSDPYPLPPMTAGTRARIQYQTHENKRIESRQRRRRQRNQNRLNALICQYNERNRAERSMQVSDTDLDHTKVAADDASALYPVEDINFSEISKAVMNLADGGTRNKNLSVNEILTFLKSNVIWRPFVDWLLPHSATSASSESRSASASESLGVSLVRFRAYDKDKNLKIDEKELGRALRDFAEAEKKHDELRHMYESTVAQLSKFSAIAKARRDKSRHLADQKKRFEDTIKEKEQMLVQETVPEKLKLMRRRLLAASYVDGGTDIELALQRADKNHDARIDCFELKSLVRSVMQVPKSAMSDAEVFGVFRALDADQSGFIEFREVKAFMEGTLWQSYRSTNNSTSKRIWGHSALPTPSHLRPSWKAPQREEEYRPESSLVNLINLKPKILKKVDHYDLMNVVTIKSDHLSRRKRRAAKLKQKEKHEASVALVARITTPNPSAVSRRKRGTAIAPIDDKNFLVTQIDGVDNPSVISNNSIDSSAMKSGRSLQNKATKQLPQSSINKFRYEKSHSGSKQDLLRSEDEVLALPYY